MSEASTEQQLLALKTENDRLQRINSVLIERIESGRVTGPYAAFEHSVVLAEQVWERTGALNQALSDLKISHQALKQANAQTAMFQQLLMDAIDSISDAFVLFDERSRIMLFNQPFADLWQCTAVDISVGVEINNLEQLAHDSGLVQECYLDDNNTQVYRLCNGQWVQASERPTSNGGRVVLYTDISRLKATENQRREQALAQKMHLLQATMDNLAQGVVLVGPDGRVALWNQRFTELTCASEARLASHPHVSEVFSDDSCDSLLLSEQADCPVFTAPCRGRMLEVQSHPTPDGGFVATYLDITERHQHAEKLRESARWIRMITDQVPALIAYVDSRLRYSFTNQQYNRWYGWDKGQAKGKTISQVLGEAQVGRLLPWVDRALGGEAVTFEVEEADQDGELRYMQRSYVPDLNPRGQAVGIFVLARDITERRRSAEALSEAYQTMEQRVHERTSELVALNDQLRQEVDERARAEAAAGEARREAERANLSKTKFLAAVSHDLLQPLNAARLFISALADRELAGESTMLVESAGTAMEDVESLISTLIDISKLDAGTVKPDKASFRLPGLLNNIAHEFSHIAESEGVRFRFRGLNQVVHSDSQLLARIVRNLLSNAIRYTPGGEVLLACRARTEGVEIQVWDTGMGIPQTQLQAIFQEFKRLPNQRRRDSSLGLGLAIVDKMAAVLGHRIKVRSEEGRGSMFSVLVPCGVIRQAPLPASIVQMPGLERLTGAPVWVIDNDQAICDGMSTLLGGWGCQVLTARSREHLQLQVDVAGARVGLVIADYHLDNDASGLDLVSWLNNQRVQPAPVLMITANHSPALKHSIRERGYELMHKPIKPLKLKTAVLHLLSSA